MKDTLVPLFLFLLFSSQFMLHLPLQLCYLLDDSLKLLFSLHLLVVHFRFKFFDGFSFVYIAGFQPDYFINLFFVQLYLVWILFYLFDLGSSRGVTHATALRRVEQVEPIDQLRILTQGAPVFGVAHHLVVVHVDLAKDVVHF